MCGIAGIYNKSDAVSSDSIHSLLSGIAHRGPDGIGVFTDKRLGLGHVRLSIIDLSQAGAQPMKNEDGSVIVVCNGEIYNYQELRIQLESKGHIFSSHSDSEVLIHLYEEHKQNPAKMLDNVLGMFAFAIYDLHLDQLIIARDRIGIKPLFYRKDNNGLSFCSEITGFEKLSQNTLSIDWTSVYEYLQLLTIPGPNTIYNEVKCLLPATMIIARGSDLKEVKYWHLPAAKEQHFSSESEVTELVDKTLSDIVQAHMVADVPVGSFLSAGIDSSLVSYYAARSIILPNQISTFCATFPGEPEDEGKLAAETAARLSTNHFEFALTSGFTKDLEEVVSFMDQPMGLTSAVSLYQISRLARKHVKVVLTGDGGDEIFGGYDHRHVPFFIPSPFPAFPASVQITLGKLMLLAPAKSKLNLLGKTLSLDIAQKYFNRIKVMDADVAFSLIPTRQQAQVDRTRYLQLLRSFFRESAQLDQMNQLLYVDINTTLADEMLFKADRMTMACALEGRVPLLDHRLVALALTIPSEFKRNGEWGKVPLRKLVEQKIDKNLAFRKKTGFNSPLASWLKNDPLTRQTFENNWKTNTLLDTQTLSEVKQSFENDGGISASNIFSIMVLNLWAEKRV